MATPKRRKSQPARADRAQGGLSFFSAYLEASRAPLAILVFLAPLILLYELLLVYAVRSGQGLVTIDAHRWILSLFEAMELGTFGLWLPGVLVVVVLLSWHAIERRPWTVDGSVIGLMWSESILAALPLVVFSQAALRFGGPAAAVVDFESLPLASKIAVSVGAGIYEELVFRLGLIGILLVVLEDAMKVAKPTAMAVAVAISAVAFTIYHPLRGAEGGVQPARVVFYLAAGVYFGVLFAARGFGIAVGAHAFYDIASAIIATRHAGPE